MPIPPEGGAGGDGLPVAKSGAPTPSGEQEEPGMEVDQAAIDKRKQDEVLFDDADEDEQTRVQKKARAKAEEDATKEAKNILAQASPPGTTPLG